MQLTGMKFCRTPKILIVEDDSDQRRLTAKIIQDAFECEIFEASDGLDALMALLLEKEDPDLILLDLILPCLNGVEFLKIIRGRPEFDHIPIVICTSVIETKEIRGVMGGWVHSYLTKPINKARLLDKVVPALHDITVRVDYQH